jgi:hypothetical protein
MKRSGNIKMEPSKINRHAECRWWWYYYNNNNNVSAYRKSHKLEPQFCVSLTTPAVGS